MKTDTYFEIGSTHDVCQDFALAGQLNEQISFAIITDGCTESHKQCGEVDFGARVLAYAARDVLLAGFCDRGGASNDLSAYTLTATDYVRSIRQQVLERVLPVQKQFRLHELFADATLLIALMDRTLGFVFVYGDGGVIVKDALGKTTYIQVDYTMSAPYYMMYTAVPERNQNYQNEFGKQEVIVTKDVLGNNEFEKTTIKTIDEKIYEATSFWFTNPLGITVTSDGIRSFQKADSNGVVNVPATDMAKRFTDFKNTNGCFQQRRMKKLQQECQKDGTTHYDDISAASIII